NWKNLSTGARCAYNNNAGTAETYGYLYNWFALNDSRNIAPEGWRVATEADWQTLANSLGGTAEAGGKMKEAGTTHWQAPNTGATNESGFTALPGGCRDLNGNFYLLGRVAYFWTATAIDANGAWNRVLSYEDTILNSVGPNKTNGFSVRLIRE
ncbi:MAG TPA: hypothetical protein ENN03_11575, partial [bacterium]|nr:hypothetical protein [bacterium]